MLPAGRHDKRRRCGLPEIPGRHYIEGRARDRHRDPSAVAPTKSWTPTTLEILAHRHVMSATSDPAFSRQAIHDVTLPDGRPSPLRRSPGPPRSRKDQAFQVTISDDQLEELGLSAINPMGAGRPDPRIVPHQAQPPPTARCRRPAGIRPEVPLHGEQPRHPRVPAVDPRHAGHRVHDQLPPHRSRIQLRTRHPGLVRQPARRKPVFRRDVGLHL